MRVGCMTAMRNVHEGSAAGDGLPASTRDCERNVLCPCHEGWDPGGTGNGGFQLGRFGVAGAAPLS